MEETIAAIATAYGEGGIGIIRISGEKSLDILEKVFVPIKKKYNKNSDEISSERFLPESMDMTIGAPIVNRRLTYGNIVDPATGRVIDEVLAVYMRAPYTYTTEDVVEINCHGSIVALRKTLELVLREGARIAEPGEFTKRAFLNGRLDLSQAEAVIDLIKSKTDKNFDLAMEQLSGGLSERIKQIRNLIMDLLVNITVNLDYPDEDIEELTYENMNKSLLQIGNMIEILLSTSNTGRLIKEGISIAIIGKPNVGKSSLMNALLREQRAIVTEIPGTTRDTIEEAISIQNIPVKLTDTAGIRKTHDTIEQIGIEKSKESFNKADLILFMLDKSRALEKEDLEIIDIIGERKVIVLLNKNDLGQEISVEEISQRLPNSKIITTAIAKAEGINQIEQEIVDLVYGGQVRQNESLLITNARHKSLLEGAMTAIKDALSMTEAKEALDFIEIDVKRSYEILGEIIGETVSEDIIDEVFARFCLGK